LIKSVFRISTATARTVVAAVITLFEEGW